jgi:hypothetical protein
MGGSNRGGFSTKIHVRCAGTGRLITFLLTPGQESDINLAEELMETGLFVERLVTDDYDLSVWWQTKSTLAVLFETISIANIFVVPSLIAVLKITEVRSTNKITEREISLKDSSIA